jgi:hypothetical protein
MKAILAIAKDNGYPPDMMHNLKMKLMAKTHKQNRLQENMTTLHPRWVTFTYFSPLIRRVTNLFKHTDIRIAFLAINIIQQQLTEKQTLNNPSGIYKLKCNTCNNVYVGQSGRAIKVRYKEHIRYIRTNNSTSAYATHILQNRNEYGTSDDTLQLLTACRKYHV